MLTRHIAAYGSVALERDYCSKCKRTALVIDNRLQCCDSIVSSSVDQIPVYQMSESRSKRNKVKDSTRELIIEFQDRKCFYCRKKFGSKYFKKSDRTKKVSMTKPVLDHIYPYIAGGGSDHNLVASCNLCNSVKSSKTFNNLLEITQFTKSYLQEKIVFV